MPFVVITAVVIVNNGDDNAWCFVSAVSFVVFFFCCSNQTGFVGRRAAVAGKRRIAHTEGCTLLLLSSRFEFKTQDANPDSW